MIWILYYLLIYLMVAGIRISALWNEKSQQWIKGRKNWKQDLHHLAPKSSTRIWFHVSSLGEFEQARPVIEKIKLKRPGFEIILTFFSPSGFTIREKYPMATVKYLPADLPGNAKHWIRIVQPDLAVFVKYDLWPGYLQTLNQEGIPTLLISAHWLPGRWWNSWSLPPTRKLLKQIKMIFLQREEHLEYFKAQGFNHLQYAGDTRIDRCLSLPEESAARIPALLKSLGPFDLIAGSTWPPDEKILIKVISQLKLKVIIAPHDVSEGNIQRLIKSFPIPVTRLSLLVHPEENPQVIIIDRIGLLSALYAIGKIAYVGGGFGSGIHNTLEPMAHQKPVMFGPAFSKFPEAITMIQLKGAWSVSNSRELKEVIRYLQQPGHAEKAGKTCKSYLQQHAGATEIVTDYILESIPYSTAE